MIFIGIEDLIENLDGVLEMAKREETVLVCTDLQSEVDLNVYRLPEPHSAARRQDFANQLGFTFIELIIAVTLISLALLFVGTVTSLSASALRVVQLRKAAEPKALEVVSKLKAQKKQTLPAGGAFRIDGEKGNPYRNLSGGVDLRCNSTYCDRIYQIRQQENSDPTEIAIGWDDPVPENATLKFIRAWTVTDEDETRNWRRITIAVFPAESNVPLAHIVTGGVIR